MVVKGKQNSLSEFSPGPPGDSEIPPGGSIM
jgi:hypothetical protein